MAFIKNKEAKIANLDQRFNKDLTFNPKILPKSRDMSKSSDRSRSTIRSRLGQSSLAALSQSKDSIPMTGVLSARGPLKGSNRDLNSVKGFNKFTRPSSRGGAPSTSNSLSRLELKNTVKQKSS